MVRLERELLLLRKRNERLIHEKESADKRVSELLSGGAAGAGVAAGEVAIVHEKLFQTQQQLTEVTEKYNRILADGGGRYLSNSHISICCVLACRRSLSICVYM